jgi:hypothetical protein
VTLARPPHPAKVVQGAAAASRGGSREAAAAMHRDGGAAEGTAPGRRGFGG